MLMVCLCMAACMDSAHLSVPLMVACPSAWVCANLCLVRVMPGLQPHCPVLIPCIGVVLHPLLKVLHRPPVPARGHDAKRVSRGKGDRPKRIHIVIKRSCVV